MCEISDIDRRHGRVTEDGLHLKQWMQTCRSCGAEVFGQRGCESVDRRVDGRCGWDNCNLSLCPDCGARVGRWSVGPAGYPDCPCDGREVPKLRWPWISHRFVDVYCAYHMWAFGLRVGGGWRRVFTPVPYWLFGNYTGALYRDARLNNPGYFERKRGGSEVES